MRLSRSTLSFLAQINNLPWSFIKIRCSSLAAPQKALQSPHRSWGRPGLSSVTSNNALILTDNPYLDRAGEPDIGGSPCHRRPHRHEPASCPTGAPRPLLEAPPHTSSGHFRRVSFTWRRAASFPPVKARPLPTWKGRRQMSGVCVTDCIFQRGNINTVSHPTCYSSNLLPPPNKR